MKKHYKTKPINITKLKTYLKDANKTDSKRSRGSSGSEQRNSKRNNLHKYWGCFKNNLISSVYNLYCRQVVVSQKEQMKKRKLNSSNPKYKTKITEDVKVRKVFIKEVRGVKIYATYSI